MNYDFVLLVTYFVTIFIARRKGLRGILAITISAWLTFLLAASVFEFLGAMLPFPEAPSRWIISIALYALLNALILGICHMANGSRDERTKPALISCGFVSGFCVGLITLLATSLSYAHWPKTQKWIDESRLGPSFVHGGDWLISKTESWRDTVALKVHTWWSDPTTVPTPPAPIASGPTPPVVAPVPPATSPHPPVPAPAPPSTLISPLVIEGIEFCICPAGSVERGSPEDELGRDDDEARTPVTIASPFAISTYEITVGTYWDCIDPSHLVDPDDRMMPITNVSFDEAVEFCKQISAKTGRTIRLPNETEWEYACRAGAGQMFSVWRGDLAGIVSKCKTTKDLTPLERRARTVFNFDSASAQRVDMLKDKNGYGLIGMHGNVWEWCTVDYTIGDDAPSLLHAPIRGGAWSSGSCLDCRSANRSWERKERRLASIGFRVVVELD